MLLGGYLAKSTDGGVNLESDSTPAGRRVNV